MDVSIDAVRNQPTLERNKTVVIALRLSLSDEGSDGDLFSQAGRVIARNGPKTGHSLGFTPMILAARLWVFTPQRQGEDFLIDQTLLWTSSKDNEAFLEACFGKTLGELDLGQEALLAARSTFYGQRDIVRLTQNRDRILDRMKATGAVTDDAIAAAKATSVLFCP